MNKYRLEWRDKEQKPLILTEEQAQVINAKMLQDTVLNFRINGLSYTVARQAIKGVFPVTESVANSNDTLFYVCDFGVAHKHLGRNGFEDCFCAKDLNLTGLFFHKILSQLYPKWSGYNSDILPHMRSKVLEEIRKMY